jgi:hypothetical protein
MKDIEFIKITKEEFEKLDEKNLIFITNPGRMGDTDGSNFIVKIGNVFYPYRVSNWMYSTDKAEITLEEFSKKFPLWMDMWNKADENENEKYQYIYMGFGNGLSIDKSIYDEYYPYFESVVKSNEDYEEDENGNYPYHIAYNSWDTAFIEMCEDKKYKLNQ